MRIRTGVFATVLAASLVVGGSALSQDNQPDPAAMIKRMQEALKLTDHHQRMNKLVGKWKITREMKMMGGGKTPGTAEYKWVVGKRWMSARTRIPMMGMMTETFVIMGYDKVKKKFVSTGVSSAHPGIISTEGPMVDPQNRVEVQYGTMDEYLTDEHDKPIKYVTTWVNDD